MEALLMINNRSQNMEEASTDLYRCSYSDCQNSYATKTNLRRHVRINHLELHTYSCPVCSKTLHSQQTMREHMNSHTGIMPFVCAVPACRKRFKFSSQLSNHRKSHPRREEKPAGVNGAVLPKLSIMRQQQIKLPLHPCLASGLI